MWTKMERTGHRGLKPKGLKSTKCGGLMVTRFRGHAEARLDEKGRLKMPSVFRKIFENTYGASLFITALTDDYLQIYPLQIWEEIEAKVNRLGAMSPLRRKFMTRANRFGTEVEMDSQGRVSLKPNQRHLVNLEDQIVLIGCTDHLEMWPADRSEPSMDTDAFSLEDFSALGI